MAITQPDLFEDAPKTNGDGTIIVDDGKAPLPPPETPDYPVIK